MMVTLTRAALTAVAAAAAISLAGVPAASGSIGSLGSTGSLGSLGSIAPAPEPEPEPEPETYERYVALGDSYAALGDQSQLADDAGDCGNSLTNYPRQLDANPRVDTLVDASCGGAQIPDVVADQVSELNADTDLVTLSIGGNDVGFAMIVGCITRQDVFAQLPPTTTCRDQIGETIASDIAATFAEDGPLDGLYDDIAQRAPDATVVATRYLPLMPAVGSCTFTDQLHPDDVAWAREVAGQINTAVDTAAERNGHVSVLPTDTVDRSACASADQRWTDFLGGAPTFAAAMHPTTLGQEAMAGAIADAI